MIQTPAGRLILAMTFVVMLTAVAAGALAQEEPLVAGFRVEGNDYISPEVIISHAEDIVSVGQPLTDKARDQIRTKLMRLGYFDTVVIATEPADKGATVVIAVTEKQKVSQVVIVGNTVFSDEDLKEQILIREGHLIDDNTIRNDVRRIEDYYTQEGYLAQVSDASADKYGRITFVIEEARIEDVKIKGLERTKPSVVERHVFLEPGQLYQEKQLIKQARDIFNIGIFADVDANPQPGVDDPVRGVIVVIEVQEKKTGQFALAAGYTSFDDFVLMLSVAENNFRGRAERAKADVELFGRTSYSVDYFNPWIDHKGTSFNINVFDTERKRQFMGS
ncbi:MAG: POTRA domain-containing protein, partial [Armatimonadota bacterium]